MKNNIILNTTLLALILLPMPVYAINPSLFPTRAALKEERMEKRQEIREAVRTTGTQLRKDKALEEVDRRVAALNRVLQQITNVKRLTDAQKTSLSTQVQSEIDKLTQLRSNIVAETDPVKLKEYKQSIVNAYRIFALFIPKIEIIIHADKLINITELMAGKTTNDSLLIKLAQVKTNVQGVIDTIIPLTPEGYPGNKSTLQSARTTLKNALKDLNEVRALMKTGGSSSSSSSSSI